MAGLETFCQGSGFECHPEKPHSFVRSSFIGYQPYALLHAQHWCYREAPVMVLDHRELPVRLLGTRGWMLITHTLSFLLTLKPRSTLVSASSSILAQLCQRALQCLGLEGSHSPAPVPLPCATSETVLGKPHPEPSRSFNLRRSLQVVGIGNSFIFSLFFKKFLKNRSLFNSLPLCSLFFSALPLLSSPFPPPPRPSYPTLTHALDCSTYMDTQASRKAEPVVLFLWQVPSAQPVIPEASGVGCFFPFSPRPPSALPLPLGLLLP